MEELSIKEISEAFLEEPKKDKYKRTWRSIMTRPSNEKIRLVPELVIETAKENLKTTDDVEKTIRYILNGFYIFRDTVCGEMFAPLYKTNDAYEWLSPAKFSWQNIDAVILGGEYIHGHIPSDDSSVKISVEENGKIKETKLELEETERKKPLDIMGKEEIIRDIIPGKDDLAGKLKYKIDDMSRLGLVFQMDWQNSSLKSYANPLYWHLDALVKNKVSKEESKNVLIEGLEILSRGIQEEIGVYYKPARKKLFKFWQSLFTLS